MIVEVSPEIEQLVFEIRSCPEQGAIQALASNGADQPFHKGMGQGNTGDGFDLGHLKYPQIGLPLRKPINPFGNPPPLAVRHEKALPVRRDMEESGLSFLGRAKC